MAGKKKRGWHAERARRTWKRIGTRQIATEKGRKSKQEIGRGRQRKPEKVRERRKETAKDKEKKGKNEGGRERVGKRGEKRARKK